MCDTCDMCDMFEMCDMSRSHVWQYGTCVTWVVHMCDNMRRVWPVWHVTHIIGDMCDMSRSHLWHVTIRGIRHGICDMHMCDIVWHVWRVWYVCHVWHDSSMRMTWLIHMRDMTHSYAWHDFSTRVTWLIHCVTWLIHACGMTHLHAWHASSIFTCVTWLIHQEVQQPYVFRIHWSSRGCSRVWHDAFTCVND